MTSDAVSRVPEPVDEVVREYGPGSAERAALERRVDELVAAAGPLPMVIGGERRFGGGERVAVVQPHHHAARLGEYGNATREDAKAAVAAALAAGPEWRSLGYQDRAAVLLRAAELLAGPWRATVVAATVLGQSLTVRQAELEVCALVDGWRRAVAQGRELLAEQPASAPGEWRRADIRPLAGFVHAVSPAVSTAAAGLLPTLPALLGNTVVWRPAPAQTLAAHHLAELLAAAGLPPGVVNLLTGDGQPSTQVLLAEPALAGVHGPAAELPGLWPALAARPGGPPRVVGAPDGGAFLLAHPGAEPAAVRSALLRGAFEHRGPAAPAIARAHLPRGLWRLIAEELLAEVDALPVGDVTDLTNFLGALPDRAAFDRATALIERAKADPAVELVAGGQYDDAIGWFVRPTVLLCPDPAHELFRHGCPGPVLAVHAYEDWEQALAAAAASPYAPAGVLLARDRGAIASAVEWLRFAADALHVNDRPVAVAPVEGLRAWARTRTVREEFGPPAGHRYAHLG
ncbi:1-pyrroline-5-carboxylate dehydrogenase [Kitasatospora sp. MMS16-BH015]|uniref:aldehyde dehydrogenase family protein n=1 Tax=Kitasatospora sp. MMS16-BH015 TaxID=2018025 RepID=UPI000CA1FED3|nr:aldehyde dehydrogenase family protein [Kitasatospora sp. MMS16-BH015]AUG77521.1 1-pyrroline-5-carboxylate dehydrogenase [Kitasatospora sp. MMS16-BH015]